MGSSPSIFKACDGLCRGAGTGRVQRRYSTRFKRSRCSLLESAGAGHKVWILLDVERVVRESFQRFVVLRAVATVGSRERLSLEGFEFGLVLSNLLLFVHCELLVALTRVERISQPFRNNLEEINAYLSACRRQQGIPSPGSTSPST